MAKKIAKRALYVAEETTFGVDPSSTGASYAYIHANSDLPNWANEIVESALQNDRLAPTMPEVGKASGGFTFRAPLRANGGNAGAAAQAPELDLVLKHLFGAVTRGVGTAVGAAATTTSVPVTSAAGLMKGAVVWIEVLGVPYARIITNIVANTLTVAPALPGSPATGQKVYAANYYTHADVGLKSLAFVQVVDDTPITFLGCKCTGKISGLAAGGQAMLEVTVEADSWVVGGKASLPAATDLFPLVRAPVIKGAPCWYGVGGTYPARLIQGLEVDFGIESQYIETTEAANNRSGFEVTGRKVEATVEAWYDADFATHIAGGYKCVLAAMAGVYPGGAWGVSIPSGMVKSLQPADRNGMLGQRLTVGAYDTDSADAEFILSVF